MQLTQTPQEQDGKENFSGCFSALAVSLGRLVLSTPAMVLIPPFYFILISLFFSLCSLLFDRYMHIQVVLEIMHKRVLHT